MKPRASFGEAKADQMNQLVEARKVDTNLGFMARLLALAPGGGGGTPSRGNQSPSSECDPRRTSRSVSAACFW